MSTSIGDQAVRRDIGFPRRAGGTPPSRARRKVPLPPLIAMAMFATVGLIGLLPEEKDDGARPIAHRSLAVATSADETVTIRDATSGRLIKRLPGNVDSFVRGVFHSLNIYRTVHAIRLDTPYELSEMTDGRVILSDPKTATKIDLEGFGARSASSFTALLDLPPLGAPE